MKELDFDELDRAVNSLMTNASKATQPPKKDGEQTLTITPTIKADDAPSLDMLDTKMSQITGQPSQAEPSTTSMAASTVAPASKSESTPVSARRSSASVAARRGRFMDMVRPGAAGQPATAAAAPVSRQGVAIEPSRPIVHDIIPPTTPKSPEALMPAKAEIPSAPQLHTDIEPDTAGNNDSEWPDPLDIPSNSKKDTPTASKSSGSIFGDEPLSSPFLPDTRVEKRPLGGVSTTPDALIEPPLSETKDKKDAEQSDASEKDDVKEASRQLPADPIKVSEDAPLPEELSGDVIALESDANTIAMPASTEKAAIVADQEDALKPDHDAGNVAEKDTVAPAKEISNPISEIEDTGEPAVQPIVPTGPISIPQQYREEPSTGDKENGAIYDTDTYHQPLAHPKKNKSGWTWVVWIVLFLAIGAAGGAALFFLGVF